MTLDLNNFEASSGPKKNDFDLIPVGTVARAIITVKPGTHVMEMFGKTQSFHYSAQTKAKWVELEFTIIGGNFDKRKVWDRLFVDGDKMNPNTNKPVAYEIGMSTLRAIIDSINGLDPSDRSENAQRLRSLNGIEDINGREFCMKIGIKKGTNGYEDSNKLMAALTPKDADYIGGNGGGNTAPANPSPINQGGGQAPQGNVPSWAK
tara:strand:+ start:1421 stop:2038 length:618 start_codon:yes stop_codon:yes gene_type:complete